MTDRAGPPQVRLSWRIYYADGSVFSSSDGAHTAAPARGVLVIVQPDFLTGRSLWSDTDFYWWEPKHQRWIGGDLAGLLDYLGCCPTPTVLQGRTVPDDVYRKTKQRALHSPDFSRKSADYPREALHGQAA